MKLHLPVLLRKALLACFAFSLASGAAHAADLTLGGEDLLTIDYAEADSIPDLAGCTLQLKGDTNLLLSNCGSGDGKTYTLFTGVSGLVDAEGNPISLDSTNNAISNYFDITQPGTGFWADGTLVLTDDGTLQLVLHNEVEKNAVTVSTRQYGGVDYQYYEGVSFADIEYTSSSSDAQGGAIYVDSYSTITLSNNGSVLFEGNTASSGSSYAEGGAIYGVWHSTITLSNNGSVLFEGNTASTTGSDAYAYGGAISGGPSSTITLSNNGSVVFEGNSATSSSSQARGGAIYGLYHSTITLSNNGSVAFSGNTASSGSSYAEGGAISGDTITLSNNGSVLFEGNTTSSTDDSASGGAISGSTITLSNNGSVVFEGNTASTTGSGDDGYVYASGGAISGSTITLSNNGSVEFIGNTASTTGSGDDGYDYASGGAICGYSSSTITLSDNGSVEFIGNTASSCADASGGAIYGDDSSTITLSDNGSVEFIGNTASSGSYSAYGGAIYGYRSTITLSNNESVEFIGNTVAGLYAEGGAIYGLYSSTITLSNNESVVFEGNTASSGSYSACGGAIYGARNSTITLSNNGSVVFEGNTASGSSASGGAIYGYYNSTIELSNNGSVVFEGNTASGSDLAYGGAIGGYGNSPITLSNNGSVVFTGNSATSTGSYVEAYVEAFGGAIYTEGNLSIQNNDSVLFEKNAEISEGTYRLRSIYAGGSGDVISLSAAAGKSIEFRDAVCIDSGSTVNLNADYGDVKQQGDIIFTSKYTEQHLNELLEAAGAGRTATASEILNSRTTAVFALTNLYGGRLRVEDGAIYMGYGITVHEDSAATVLVKDATLSHEGYDLTFNAGTTLELAGANSITGNVQMLDDSTLRLVYAADTILSLTGNLSFDGTVTMELEGFGEGSYELVSQNGGTLSGWDMDALRFMNGQGESLDASRFTWVDKSLYYIGSVENLIWTNASGDGLWSNVSLNWEADGTPFALTVLQNIILGAGKNETITVVGNQVVNSLTVQQGGQYTLAGDTAGTKLTVTGDVLLEENASLSLQGNLESGALKGAGSLSVSGTLTLTDATASSSIDGDVSVSGALKTAGVLTVGGALKAGSLAGGSNELAVSGNITLGSMTGDANVLTSGGSATTGAINGSHNSITAVTLVTTNGKALTGDYNTLEATAGQVFVQGLLKGNYNTLKGGKAPADGNTISVWSGINGNNNVLLAEEGNVVTHAIDGSHNSITAAALVTTNGKTLTGDYNTLESTAGQVYVQGVLTGSHNTLKASAAPSASDPNALCVWGGIVGDYNQLLTTGGNIAMTSFSSAKVQGNHNTLEATEGAILVRDILGAENTLTAGTYISAGAVGAAGAGSNGNTLTAGTYVNINGKLTGDSNDISSSGTDSGNANGIRIATGLEGDGNKLTAEAGRIVIGGGTSLNGSNNTLLAKGSTSGGEGITLDGNLAGSGNKLTAETGNIKLGNITGDSNTLEAEAGTITASTINGTGNTLKGATVQVNGELKGSANTIEGNAVQVGTLSGSGHGITALAGNVSIGSLNDTAQNSISTGASYGITVGSGSASNQTWTAGSLSVTGAAGLSLTDSTVTVSGTVESAKLNLGGASSLAAATLSVNSVSLLTDAAVSMTLETADVAELYLQAGATLDVNGTLNAGTVTMQQLTSSAPGLTVGQFAVGETIFCLDVEMVNALNLGHGESVVLARADQAISGDFSAWLTSAGNSSLDAAVYRYDISVSGAEVVLTMDYANWGTRVWYGNTWVGKESWSEYMVCGYDAVDGLETVDLGGSSIAADALYIAAGEDAFTTVMANGSMSAAYAEVDGKLTIAESCALEIGELAAGAQEVQLQGELTVDTGSIGKLSGTTGELVIGAELSVNSDVTLGSLDNSGTLDIGSHSLKVASAVTNGGSVVAGNVEVHNRMSGYAVFDKLVADKVAVTNTSNSSAYTDNLSVGDGSAIGELVAEKLQVRDGVVTLGRADKATAQKLQNLELQKNATLLLNSQTELSVSNSLTAAANSAVQLEQDAALKYQEVSISNRNEDKTVSVNAAQLAAGSAELVLQDAYVTHTGNKNRELAYALVNSTVENAGSGTLQLTNAGNELSGVVASSGNVEIYNAVSGMTLDELRLAAGLSLSAAVGDAGTTQTPAGNAEVSVSGTALLAGSSTLNASLTLADGATLDLVSLNAGAVTLNGTLTFGGKISMGENLLALLNEKLGWESSVTLFTGLERVDMSALTGNSDGGLVWAGDVFSNMGDNRNFQISYVAEVGSLVVAIVPEPATSTLSLLALAALAARRRRK